PAARADVLFPALYLVSLLWFDRALLARGRTRWAFVAAATVGYAFALLSKEMAITLPAVFMLLSL
ncbi:MAG: hypothetical protein GTN62_04360, partial [Gemmatimonadales bacterium]|nr:hypothetical protein [Gemmatimonadales bacterium]NIN49332.1 hypothetical protein [Gemmatimonadales bacterium]NIP06796.1 hypothetical protein [Gemmatimonadales bacterium]NIS66403.1 hypothetical protein [Gemmatimonadales bacterium]